MTSAACPAADVSTTGIVKKLFDDRGFGFIVPDDGGDDVFFHINDIVSSDPLSEGDKVSFHTEYDDRKGKYKASNCSRARADIAEAPARFPAGVDEAQVVAGSLLAGANIHDYSVQQLLAADSARGIVGPDDGAEPDTEGADLFSNDFGGNAPAQASWSETRLPGRVCST